MSIMEPDLLFDQVRSIYRGFIDQHGYRVTRQERANQFDYRLMILESSQLKIRFTLDRMLVALAVGKLDAPDDWSRDAWFDLDVLLEYSADRKALRLRAAIDRLTSWLPWSRRRYDDRRSAIYRYRTDSDLAAVSKQLEELKRRLLVSYDRIAELLCQEGSDQIISELQRLRDRRNDNFLAELVRERR